MAGSYGTPDESHGEELDVEAMRSSAPVESSKPPASAASRVPAVGAPAARPAPPAVHSPIELLEVQQGLHADAPLCFTCGVKMQPAGSCYVCSTCGSTSGCS